MAATDAIRFLRRAQLDDAAWDSCIASAPNGTIYGYSWYLDVMADDWDGLVYGNYTAVMPLPWRKKWGIAYLYQPFLTAQLGAFGDGVNAALLSAFFHAVPKQFRLWEIPLNRGNLFPVKDFDLFTRSNYVLPLNKPYDELQAGYRENIRRNIKRCHRYGCTVTTNVSISSIIELTKLQTVGVTRKDVDHFTSLFQPLQQEGAAKTYGVLSVNGELLASAVFLFSHGRAYYLLVGNHPNGRTLGASHALIDAFIRDHAGQNLSLDFEGSDVHSLAFFYSSFGAVEEKYSAITLNRFPWWAKWLKK